MDYKIALNANRGNTNAYHSGIALPFARRLLYQFQGIGAGPIPGVEFLLELRGDFGAIKELRTRFSYRFSSISG
jgi:hypothetical protein